MGVERSTGLFQDLRILHSIKIIKTVRFHYITVFKPFGGVDPINNDFLFIAFNRSGSLM
jgi:hypothetical protein